MVCCFLLCFVWLLEIAFCNEHLKKKSNIHLQFTCGLSTQASSFLKIDYVGLTKKYVSGCSLRNSKSHPWYISDSQQVFYWSFYYLITIILLFLLLLWYVICGHSGFILSTVSNIMYSQSLIVLRLFLRVLIFSLFY